MTGIKIRVIQVLCEFVESVREIEFYIIHLIITNCTLRDVWHWEAYAEPCLTSKLELYEKIANGTLIAVIADQLLNHRIRLWNYQIILMNLF